MTKKVLCLIFSVFLILSVFSGCSKAGEGEQMVVSIDEAPQYLDPQIVSEKGSRNIIANCFEGLVRYNNSGEIVPAGCEKYSVSSNGLTYTFNLRQDCFWKITRAASKIVTDQAVSDKSEEETTTAEISDYIDTRVTAQNYVFALRRVLQPETKSPYAWSLMNIKNASSVNSGKKSSSKLGVYAKDDFTLVIELERRDDGFLSVLTSPACVPCNEEYFEYTRGHYGLSSEYLIFNGPFYISSWSEKTAITAKKNDRYHTSYSEKETLVKPSSIYFSFNNEQSSRGRKVKDGTYQAARLTLSQAEDAKENKNLSVYSFNSAVTGIIFNCNDSIVQNENIRKAIAQATDKKQILKNSNKSAALGIIPSDCMVCNVGYRTAAKSAQMPEYNVRKAIKSLKAGLDELELNTVELKVLCSEENENMVRSVMQQWQSAFGVIFTVTVETVEENALKSKINSGSYSVAFTDIESVDLFSESSISRFASYSRDNFINFSDKKFDSIIKNITKEGRAEKRALAIRTAEEYLFAKGAIIPLYESEVFYATGKGVSGIVFSPTGEVLYYKDALKK
ncbi:MAG: peptide ABC transporter substrate-binding protein [Clostridia bacterium]|nr:peptide ABC transporter substrate-binding protein [Clostridia bacterium]